jgi:hypothetical protein
MGFLDEGHKCPGGLVSRLGKAMVTVAIGAAIGIAVVYGIEDRPVPALWLAGAALGAVLAMSVRQAVRVR